MKKLVALLLALVTVFALCACGGTAGQNGPKLDRNSTDAYLGTWEYESENGNKRLIINRGGVGKYEGRNEFASTENYKNFSWSFTYEVKDETLIVTIGDYHGGSWVSSFELNEDGSALIIIQHNLPAHDPAVVEGETAFTKK